MKTIKAQKCKLFKDINIFFEILNDYPKLVLRSFKASHFAHHEMCHQAKKLSFGGDIMAKVAWKCEFLGTENPGKEKVWFVGSRQPTGKRE